MRKTLGPSPIAHTPQGQRRVRSFVLRGGRVTPAQQRALDRLWPRFGLTDLDALFPVEKLFGRSAALCVEIGFGDGAALAHAAQIAPEQDFIGIEVYRPGIGSLLQRIEQLQLNNVRAVCDDAVSVLSRCIEDRRLASLRLFFPDPWPKKRHHKRRLVQPEFIDLAYRKLMPGGVLHLATDWKNYAEQMITVIEAHPGWINQAGPGQFSSRPAWRLETKFERRGKRLGHCVWDLLYNRVGT